MRLDSIAVKNLCRRKGKSLFLLLTIMVVMGTVTGLFTLSMTMKEEVSNSFDEIGPNILVKPPESGSAFSYGGVIIPAAGEPGFQLTNDHILAINGIPERESIAVVAPKLLGLASAGERQVTVVGVDFPYELRLKKWWTYQGKAPSGQEDLLVGYKLAQSLGWAPGQVVSLNGRDFRVAAVLDEQGNDDDQVIFMQLLAAQKLLNQQDKLSFIEVAAYCSSCPIEEITAQIQSKIPGAQVVALAETVKWREETVERFVKFAWAMSGVIMTAGSLVIFLTMMAATKQRTAEIGTYRVFGYRRSHIMEIFLTEALLAGWVGGLAGFALGIPLARQAAPYVSDLNLYISWDWSLGLMVIMASIALTFLASLYPAMKAASLDPVEALRFI